MAVQFLHCMIVSHGTLCPTVWFSHTIGFALRRTIPISWHTVAASFILMTSLDNLWAKLKGVWLSDSHKISIKRKWPLVIQTFSVFRILFCFLIYFFPQYFILFGFSFSYLIFPPSFSLQFLFYLKKQKYPRTNPHSIMINQRQNRTFRKNKKKREEEIL